MAQRLKHIEKSRKKQHKSVANLSLLQYKNGNSEILAVFYTGKYCRNTRAQAIRTPSSVNETIKRLLAF